MSNENDGPWYNADNLKFAGSSNQSDSSNSSSNYNSERNENKNGDILEKAEDNALVFGILSMIFGIFALLGEKLLFGIAGLVLGKISEGKKKNTYAKVGIICSIISIVIGVIAIVICLIILLIYGTTIFKVVDESLNYI